MIDLSKYSEPGECGYCEKPAVLNTVALQVCQDEHGEEHTFTEAVCEECRGELERDTGLGGMFILHW